MEILEIKTSNKNGDLLAHTSCNECGKHLMFKGYDTVPFFCTANKTPRVYECAGCSTQISVQWFRDGVRVWR